VIIIPFKKVTHGRDKGKYRSARGKLYSMKQLKRYYKSKPKSKKQRGKK